MWKERSEESEESDGRGACILFGAYDSSGSGSDSSGRGDVRGSGIKASSGRGGAGAPRQLGGDGVWPVGKRLYFGLVSIWRR